VNAYQYLTFLRARIWDLFTNKLFRSASFVNNNCNHGIAEGFGGTSARCHERQTHHGLINALTILLAVVSTSIFVSFDFLPITGATGSLGLAASPKRSLGWYLQ
jgi:hypothetical protein